jgi:hypothetical protein
VARPAVRDTVADRFGVQPESEPVAYTPPAIPADVDLKEIIRLMAQQQAETARHVATVTNALAAIVGEKAKADKLVNDEIAKVERIRAKTNKSAQQQTQEIADARFHDGTIWLCGLVSMRSVEDSRRPGHTIKREAPDPSQPYLRVRAHSREEAEGRYRNVCGINSVDSQVARIECKPEGAAAEEAEPELQMVRR